MAVIKLSIYVSNLANVMGLFDEIQVWRSETGIGGTYFEITAAADAAATLLGSQTAPFTLNGKTLLVEVDQGTEQTITFVTADPINADDTVDFINDNLTGVTASEDGGAIRLTSDTLGTSSTLEITGGTALADLGFTTGDSDNGEDARITLVIGTDEYEFDDESGDPDNYYKVRYYNSGTGAVSSFGDPVKGNIGSIIAPTDLVKATVDLAGLDGRPLADTYVIFYNVYVPPLLVGDVGIMGKEVRVATDQAGHAETMLVKGATVDVTISGTGMIRQIVVPDTDFNILAAIAAADDLFQIQTPDIPAAVRRT